MKPENQVYFGLFQNLLKADYTYTLLTIYIYIYIYTIDALFPDQSQDIRTTLEEQNPLEIK